ncbi:hypothetical protein J6590_032798 [Homalodisca vitripennis]|nr:hypothetical protein J6590_032798 [Homalodisca vitripennis]
MAGAHSYRGNYFRLPNARPGLLGFGNISDKSDVADRFRPGAASCDRHSAVPVSSIVTTYLGLERVWADVYSLLKLAVHEKTHSLIGSL